MTTFYAVNKCPGFEIASYISGNIQQFKGETAEQTFEFHSGSATSASFEKRWSVGARASWFGLFKASGGVDHVDIQRQWKSTARRMTVRFANVRRFEINRGPWFKIGLLDQFRDRLPAEFWDSGGRLNLIPTAVVLAHGLSVSIEGAKEVGSFLYEYRRQGGGGGFRIGPFGFGGRGSRTTTLEQSNVIVEGDGFSVQDNSGRACILAVISSRPLDLYKGTVRPLHMLLAGDLHREHQPVGSDASPESRLLGF